jgi:VCBS repeat-containing protein
MVAMRRMSRAAGRTRTNSPRLRLSVQSLEDRAVPAVIANADAAYVVNVGQALHVAAAEGVLANDVGADLSVMDEDGNAENGIRVALAPRHGTLEINADGSFTYTPAADFTEGTDTFIYRATDGMEVSDIATVTLSINAAPAVDSQSLTTNEDTVLNGQLTASDAEGDGLTYALVPGAVIHGSVTVNKDGTFAFTPTKDFSGTAGFQFTATDSRGATSTPGTVIITVNQVADLYGDVNGDGFVNGADFAVFRTAFGTSVGDPNYVAALDLDGDGSINGTEFAAFRNNFGSSI